VSLWENIKTTITTKATELKQNAISLITALKDALPAIWNSVKTTVSTKWNEIKSYVATTATDMKNNAVTSFKNMVSEIGTKLQELPGKVKNGFQEAIDFLKALPAQALEWGRDFIDGFKRGIEEKIQSVVSTVRGVGESIRSLLHFSRPDEGPLRDYETWMPDFMQGLADGIRGSQHLVTEAAASLAGMIEDSFGNAAVSLGTYNTDINGATMGSDSVVEAINTLRGDVASLASTMGSLKVVMDTGTLVGTLTGPLDKSLGRQQVYRGRGI
jgi:phage-related protein